MTENDPSNAPEALLRHADFVLGVARGLLADEGLAEDVAQDTWLAALERPFAERFDPRAWLATVARRLAFRKRRRTRLGEKSRSLTLRSEVFHASKDAGSASNKKRRFAISPTLRMRASASS